MKKRQRIGAKQIQCLLKCWSSWTPFCLAPVDLLSPATTKSLCHHYRQSTTAIAVARYVHRNAPGVAITASSPVSKVTRNSADGKSANVPTVSWLSSARESWPPKSPYEGNFTTYLTLNYIHLINNLIKIYRQQNSENGANPKSSKVKSAEALLAQKKLYQKHLRTLQQSSLARDVLHSKLKPINIIHSVICAAVTLDIYLSGKRFAVRRGQTRYGGRIGKGWGWKGHDFIRGFDTWPDVPTLFLFFFINLLINFVQKLDYRQWTVHNQSNNNSSGASDSCSVTSSPSDASPLPPPVQMSERMRKRRAFADRDLDAVMYQREQFQLQMAAAASAPFQHHQKLFFGSVDAVTQKMANDDEDSDMEIDVISTGPPSPAAPPTTINKNKISFSVESIIGRPCWYINY